MTDDGGDVDVMYGCEKNFGLETRWNKREEKHRVSRIKNLMMFVLNNTG